jgi:hypothetical protein
MIPSISLSLSFAAVSAARLRVDYVEAGRSLAKAARYGRVFFGWWYDAYPEGAMAAA